MGTRSTEAEGDKPSNQGLSDFKALPKGREVGWSIKKPDELKQQISDADLEAYERFHRGREPSTVFENPIRVPRPLPRKPGEQRGESEQSQPTPVEQQSSGQRRETPENASSKARPEHDPQLRELAKYLFGGISDQYASELIARARKKYPELPPDEALREYDRREREDPNRGFTF